MNRKHLLAGVGVVGVLSVGGVVGLGAAYQQAADVEASSSAPCQPGSGPEVVPAVDKGPAAGATEQARVRNLTTLVARGKRMGVPPRGIQIGIATALTESQGLNLASRAVPASLNYPHDDVAAGDFDSIGIMQQRVSMGWFDTIANGMKVDGQVTTFFDRLLKVNGWQVMSFSGAAQAVQRSAFPDRYGQREAEAVAYYEQLAGTPAATGGPATGVVDECGVIVDSAGAVVSGEWAHPLKPAAYVLTSPFGWRVLRGIPNLHKGQDLAVPVGTDLHAVCSGVVDYAPVMDPYGGGKQVDINCGGGIVAKLMHNSVVLVTVGQKVKAGDVIAKTGNTGNSTGPHSHVQINENGQPVEPMAFFAKRGVPL